MKESSDLAGVKSVAKMLLYTDLHKTKFSPLIVQHPFTSVAIVQLRNENTGDLDLCDILNDADNLARWRKSLAAQIDEATKPMDIFFMLNKPYALTFLQYASPHLSTADFSDIFSIAWTMSEGPNSDPNMTVAKLVSMFSRCDPERLMTEAERTVLAGLDDRITVYRGVTAHNSKRVKALSWTLDYGIAEWFAQRYGEDGTVYEAQIEKQHILAYFGGRSEAEVIVNPKYLQNITEAEEPVSDFTITQQ